VGHKAALFLGAENLATVKRLKFCLEKQWNKCVQNISTKVAECIPPLK